MSGAIEVPDAWKALAARIDALGGLTLLLGASDSGKTTLARWLLRQLTAAGRRVALLDGDIGQSTIGPPATAGMALGSPFSTDPLRDPIALRFVGAVSPAEHMLPLAVGLKRLADKAYVLGAEVLLVDTTGLVFGPAGRRLKFHKIELLAPRHLIALQRHEELEPILRLFDSRKGLTISRLDISPQALPRSLQVRRSYRTQRFLDYFQVASLLEISLRDIRTQGGWMTGIGMLGHSELRGLSEDLKTPVLGGERAQDWAVLLVQGEPALDGVALAKSRLGILALRIVTADALRGLLLGLADEEGELLALGLLQELDLSSERLVCLTPLGERARIRIVHYGTLRLGPSGEELGDIDIEAVTQ